MFKGPIKVLILVLIFLILILVVLLLLSKKEGKPTLIPPRQEFISPTPITKPINIVLPTIAFTPTQIPSPIPKQKLNRQQLINLMPVITEDFDIEYLKKSDLFLVTIKRGPYDIVRTKSEQWFIDRGITDFEEFNIKWGAYPYVQ